MNDFNLPVICTIKLQWDTFEKAAIEMAGQVHLAYLELIEYKYTGDYARPNSWYDHRIGIKDGIVIINAEYYECGETDYVEIQYPFEYLNDPNWKEKYIIAEKKRIEDARIEQKRLDKERNDRLQREQDDRDRATYERLKEKFEK